MYYNLVALIILIVGLFVIFKEKTINSILLSFVLTIISFVVLVANQFYFLAIIYAIIDTYLKVYLMVYYINSKKIYRSKVFKKRSKGFKIVSWATITMFVSVFFALKKELKGPESAEAFFPEIKYEISEILVLTFTVTIFAIAGYITKSKKWNK